METLIEFFLLRDPNVRFVVLGSVLLGASTAIVGCFTFLRKKSLVGDAVAHSVLPGVAMAFMLFQLKNPLILLAGALFTGWLSLLTIDFLTQKTKVKADSAIGLVLSVFFGIGILMLTAIQNSGSAAQSGLDKFLFGKAASMVGSDITVFAIVSIILVLVVLLFFRQFTLLAFDSNHAKALGLPVKFLEFMLSTITVLAIATGIQAVGVVLMAALLITPATAARYWTDNLKKMVVIAAVIGAGGGVAGSYVSFVAPAMPTGPWIVMVISIVAIGSLFVAPNKGLLFRLLRRRAIRKQMLAENILKAFYQLGEKDNSYKKARAVTELGTKRDFSVGQFKSGLKILLRQGLVEQKEDSFILTSEGLAEGKRITRLHRLWELYLTKYLRIAPDHVHEDAEAIEHVITPEIEKRLEELLEYPEADPHDSLIPKRD